jgi:hypothetical protein
VNNGSYTRSEMDLLTEFNVEFEFNRQYIVITVAAKGDTRQNWLITNSSDWVQRMVLKGSFDYSNQKVTRAVIESAAYQQKSQNPEKGGLQIYTPESRLSPNGTPISKTGFVFPLEWTPIIRDTSSWSSVYNHVNKGYGIDIDIEGNPYNYMDGGSGPQSSWVKPMIDSYENGRFFYSGWETNPFSSNLI